MPFPSFSQIFLNTGDSFTFEFTHFDFQVHGSAGPSARVGLGLQGFAGSDVLRFDAFENNANQPPIYSTTLAAGAGSADFTFGPAWQDLQGTFRVTMLSGSATLQDCFGTVTLPNGDFYGLKVGTVPEPSAWYLLGAIILTVTAWHKVRKRSIPTA